MLNPEPRLVSGLFSILEKMKTNKQIDVVYIVGTGSKWDDNELRYSLRSLEMHGRNYRNIYIVGNIPDFVREGGGLICVPCDDPHKVGCLNHIDKVQFAIDNIHGLTDELLMMYDDVYLLADVDLSRYPYYYSCDEICDSYIGGMTGYRFAKIDTKFFLRASGHAQRDFEEHCPIRYDKRKWCALSDVWSIARHMRNGLLARSIYCNMHGIKGRHMPDCKIREDIIDKEMLDKVLKSRLWMSISDASIPFCTGSFLEERYPKKSKWEC